MKWLISENRELAEANVNRINETLRRLGYDPLLASPMMVGHEFLEWHPHWYFPYPDQEFIDKYYEGVREADLVSNLIPCCESETDPAQVQTYPRIWDLCIDSLQGVEVDAINYKGSHLKTGISLDKREVILPSGLVDFVEYSFESEIIVKVEKSWTINPDSTSNVPAAQEVSHRDKKEIYYNTDGTVHVEIDRPKDFFDRPDVRKEGTRRRENIIFDFEEQVGAALIFTGAAANKDAAYNILTAFLEFHETGFSSYMKGGRGSLYDNIQNETEHSWLDNIVPNNAETQFLIPDMVEKQFELFVTIN